MDVSGLQEHRTKGGVAALLGLLVSASLEPLIRSHRRQPRHSRVLDLERSDSLLVGQRRPDHSGLPAYRAVPRRLGPVDAAVAAGPVPLLGGHGTGSRVVPAIPDCLCWSPGVVVQPSSGAVPRSQLDLVGHDGVGHAVGLRADLAAVAGTLRVLAVVAVASWLWRHGTDQLTGILCSESLLGPCRPSRRREEHCTTAEHHWLCSPAVVALSLFGVRDVDGALPVVSWSRYLAAVRVHGAIDHSTPSQPALHRCMPLRVSR